MLRVRQISSQIWEQREGSYVSDRETSKLEPKTEATFH